MGIIKTQSIYSTLISYFGVVIGFVTSALIMPKVLTSDQLGLVKLIVAVTGLFAAIFSFGITQIFFRTFHNYSNGKDGVEKLFTLIVKIASLGCLVALPIFTFISYDIFNFDSKVVDFDKNDIFLIVVFLVIVARIFYQALFGYIKMMSRIVVDAIIQNIVLKGFVLIFIILFAVNIIDFSEFLYYHIIIYILFPFILIYYLKHNKKLPRLMLGTKFDKFEKREIFKLSIFGTLTTIGSTLFLYLDTLMISQYLGDSDVGIYTTMYLFGVIVIVPARGLKSVSISIISKSFKENNIGEIESIYKKSSITLLIVGGYIFLGVYSNLFSVFEYLPEEFAAGKYVVLFIGLGQLYDMLTGVNYEILATSKHYKINTWFVFISIGLAVLTNVIFIPLYGITGAAIATFISIFSLNSLRLFIVWKIFNIQPFTKKSILSFIILISLFVSLELIPNYENFITNLFFKLGLLSLIYLPLVYYLKLSEDINKMILNIIKLLKKNS